MVPSQTNGRCLKAHVKLQYCCRERRDRRFTYNNNNSSEQSKTTNQCISFDNMYNLSRKLILRKIFKNTENIQTITFLEFTSKH